ncbi:MAG: hypothetical protein RL589_57 [Actinomycetota bacterium]
MTTLARIDTFIRRNIFKGNKTMNKPKHLISLLVRTLVGSKILVELFREKPNSLVFFNDFLLIEKIIISLANRLGIETILIQEGFIPINNSASYLGRFLHSSPFGAMKKRKTFVFSEVALDYMRKLNKSDQVQLVVDDLWPSRFDYNPETNNIFFLASDFLTGSNDFEAHETQKTTFQTLRKFLLLENSRYSIHFVPHPNEGSYDGPGTGIMALGFNSYALEELVFKMPTYRLDFNPAISPYISEIREQSHSGIIHSIDDICDILKNLPKNEFCTPERKSNDTVSRVISQLLDG